MAALRAHVDTLGTAGRQQAAQTVAARVAAVAGALDAEVVLGFASFRDEIDTAPVLQALRRAGRTTLLPVVAGLDLLAVAVEEETPLSAGARGTPEPPPPHRAQAVDPAIVDLVVVPGLAFAESGVRLGYGGGHYDRFLPLLRREAVRLGLGYAVQLVKALPSEPHDALLDAVLTEAGLVVTDAGRRRGRLDAARLLPARARPGEGCDRLLTAEPGTAAPATAARSIADPGRPATAGLGASGPRARS